MGVLKYDSTNSGGNWWLDDEDWEALDNAGWTVHWKDNNGHTPDTAYSDNPEEIVAKVEKGGYRWLGALATTAAKRFDNPNEGIEEWEKITKQNAGSIGCTCCGAPHSFEFIKDDGKVIFAYPRIVSSECRFEE